VEVVKIDSLVSLTNSLIDDDTIFGMQSDTVFGIFAKVSDRNLEKINIIKHSPIDKPLIVLFPDIDKVYEWCELANHQKKLISYMLPNNVTFIVNLKKNYFINDISTLAIRIPKDDDLLEILSKTGPLFSTSANISNQEPVKNYKEFLEKFKNQKEINFVVKGKKIVNKKPSSIYDVSQSTIKKVR